MGRGRPVTVSQSLIVPSKLAVASRRPSGMNAIEVTRAKCPERERRCFPVSASQIFTDSWLSEASEMARRGCRPRQTPCNLGVRGGRTGAGLSSSPRRSGPPYTPPRGTGRRG